MSIGDRAALFRKRALEAESKAFLAKTEESRRAWMIVARDWSRMAEREDLKYLDAPDSRLAPDQSDPALVPGQADELEDAIRKLAATLPRP